MHFMYSGSITILNACPALQLSCITDFNCSLLMFLSKINSKYVNPTTTKIHMHSSAAFPTKYQLKILKNNA